MIVYGGFENDFLLLEVPRMNDNEYQINTSLNDYLRTRIYYLF